jgi:hypothetical protein
MERGGDSYAKPWLNHAGSGLLSFEDGDIDPIKHLMFAVLQDAVRCVQLNAGRGIERRRRILAEVEQWIEDRGSDGPFAFETICEALRINPQFLRLGLRRWRDRRRPENSPDIVVRRTPVMPINRLRLPAKHLSRFRRRGDS